MPSDDELRILIGRVRVALRTARQVPQSAEAWLDAALIDIERAVEIYDTAAERRA